MIALAGLLTLVTTLLIVSRIGSAALEATGMARDSAQFQARSALLGVGFTTNEAEDITSHPVRRKIVLYLMTLGNASIVAGIASFLLAFIDAEAQQTVRRTGILAVGLIAIIAAFHTGLANRMIQRTTHAMLRSVIGWRERSRWMVLAISTPCSAQASKRRRPATDERSYRGAHPTSLVKSRRRHGVHSHN